jgi:Flp pilus assembly protein CpaB
VLEAKRRIGLFLGLSIVLAVIIAFTVHSRVASVEAQLGDQTAIYVAARHVPAQRPLTEDDLRTVRIPRSFVQAGMLTDAKDLLGQVSLVPLAPGDLITANMLTTRYVIPPGHRALRLYRGQTLYFDDDLRPGDHVDLVATLVDDQRRETKLLLPRLPIVETDPRAQWVAVLVPEASANDVIYAENFARQLQLLRLSPEPAPAHRPSAQYDPGRPAEGGDQP